MFRYRFWIFWLAGWMVSMSLTAGEGSNLGSQATHYTPPVVEGTVTFGATPSDQARINTLAGQRTATDAAGTFDLTLDAPGIYRITVTALLNVHIAEVEVFTDQTLTLNVNLGSPCAIDTWPAPQSITEMVTCINNNLPAPKQ